MKHAKSLVSLILVITLLLSLSLTVHATDPTETITVIDAKINTYYYKAYKIFDASVDDTTHDVVYTLASGSDWVDVLIANKDADVLVSNFPGLEYTKEYNTSNPPALVGYRVIRLPEFSSADFAAWLEAHKPSGISSAPSSTNSTNDTVTFDVSGEPGYYLVTYGTTSSASGASPYALTTVLTGQNVTVQNKHDMPFDKEVFDAAGNDINETGVQIGDVLTFKITGKVPSVASADTFYYYYVKDTLSKGLEFDKDSLAVKIITDPADSTKDVDVKASMFQVTDYTASLIDDQYRIDERGNAAEFTFDLSVDVLTRVKDTASPVAVGQDIVITYQAKVTEDAKGHVINNRANLTYGNDPLQLVNKDAETRNYVSQIIIDKFETGNNAQKLAGAEFVLYKKVTEPSAVPGAAPVEVKYYYRNNVDQHVVTWITCDDDDLATNAVETVNNSSAAAAITKVVTNNQGAADFVGLADGTYYLHEIKAPDGYFKLTDDVKITINGKAALDPSLTPEGQQLHLTQVANVANTPGTVMPSTGGSGLTLFYVGGAVLILAVSALVIFRKREETEDA